MNNFNYQIYSLSPFMFDEVGRQKSGGVRKKLEGELYPNTLYACMSVK